MPNLDPVHKVTILPRGRSLGHTLVLPLEDRYTQTRSEILDQLVYALGGRAAEELVFHEPTTGASDDIEKATHLARSMVTEYGMSSKLGAVKYGTSDSEPFLGRDYGHQRDYSEDIAADIDSEVRDLIEAAHDEAWEILVQYRDALDAMVRELVEKETLAKEDLERILAPVRKRPPHNTFTGFGKRTPSDRPPIEIPPSARSNGSSTNGAAALPGVQPPPDAPAPVGPMQPEPPSSLAPSAPPTGQEYGQTQDFGPTQTYGSPQSFGEQPTAYLPHVPAPPPAAYPTYPERRQQPGTDGSQGSA
jgi:cell division protease FtsH